MIWRSYSERKYEDADYEAPNEKYEPELLVIEEGELVTTLNDSTVGRQDLIRLLRLVETKTDRATKLFGSPSKP